MYLGQKTLRDQAIAKLEEMAASEKASAELKTAVANFLASKDDTKKNAADVAALIPEVEKAAKEGQAVDKAEIEKLLADQKKWKLDETDPSDLKVHPSEDAVGDDELNLAVKQSGLKYYVTVNVAEKKDF